VRRERPKAVNLLRKNPEKTTARKSWKNREMYETNERLESFAETGEKRRETRRDHFNFTQIN
jgi:hypothetical protein